MQRFLIVNPFGIGDVLFTTPLIRAIKEDNPRNLVSYWCNQRVGGLFSDDPDIEKVFAFSRGDLKKLMRQSVWAGAKESLGLIKALKKERFDTAIDFSFDHRYGLLLKIIGVPRRIGYDYKNRGRFLTDRLRLDCFQDRHVAEYYLELLRLVDIYGGEKRLRLYLSDDDRASSARILRDCGIGETETLIGIAPAAGSSWGKDAFFKHWPAENFSRLSDRITGELGFKVLIMADASERNIVDLILAKTEDKPVDLTGKLSLKELAAVISRLRLLVCNDGGPLHIASAVGVKTVSIFGPVDENVYGPYPPSASHRVITNRQALCRPCYQNFRFPGCAFGRRCLEGIEAEEVFSAVKQLSGLGG